MLGPRHPPISSLTSDTAPTNGYISLESPLLPFFFILLIHHSKQVAQETSNTPSIQSLFPNTSSTPTELIMYFSKVIAITVLLVTGAVASPQGGRPRRPVFNQQQTNSVNQQSISCGNGDNQTLYCCNTDNQSGRVNCAQINCKFHRDFTSSPGGLKFVLTTGDLAPGGTCSTNIVCCNANQVVSWIFLVSLHLIVIAARMLPNTISMFSPFHYSSPKLSTTDCF